MQLDEQQFAARIATALDERELPAHIASRLMGARNRALAAVAEASPSGRNTLVLFRQAVVGLMAAYLLILGAGFWYTINMHRSGYAITLHPSENDIVEVDSAVLSGDLPVQAYLDPGFAAYLNRFLSTE